MRRLERGGSTLKVKAEKAKEQEASNPQTKQDIPPVTYEFIDLEESKAKYDIEKFDEKWEGLEKLRWRMVQMPGGAIKKPDAFYWLYGLGMQATEGDNDTERPMWAEKGGLDFEGRARWDEYEGRKGMDQEEAKQRFVEFFEAGYDPKKCTSPRVVCSMSTARAAARACRRCARRALTRAHSTCYHRPLPVLSLRSVLRGHPNAQILVCRRTRSV